MKPHLRYLAFVLRHKWFVLVAGLRVGAPLWRLLIHDWSKFTPAEWGGYVDHFYAPKPLVTYGDERNVRGTSPDQSQRITAERKAAFDLAWLHHQKRNKHHWQYWLLVPDRPDVVYHLESHDGGSTGNVLVGKGEHPRTEVYLPALDINLPGADERLRLVNRVLELAARGGEPLEMPEKYVREMVADWMGAGRAITGRWEVHEWYRRNWHLVQIHPNTRKRVEALVPRAPASPQT